MPVVLVFLLVVLGVVLFVVSRALAVAKRAEHIRGAPLPKGLYDKLRARRPALTAKDCQLVAQGLRQFFLAYLKSGCQPVAMPSQVVDELWHEFILYTRDYERFCQAAFGRFMHHTPAVVLGSVRQSNAGLRRCWWHACRAENINPRSPTRLPLLFAIDTKLAIEGGFRYVPDCGPLKRSADTGAGTTVIYCAGDFGSGSVDGSTDGFGDASSDGGSDGGGGDSGCGGGCSS